MTLTITTVLQTAGGLHNIRGDVQDRPSRAEDAEGEESGALSEEYHRAGRARGQARQGSRSDAQTGHYSNQGGVLKPETPKCDPD